MGTNGTCSEGLRRERDGKNKRNKQKNIYFCKVLNDILTFVESELSKDIVSK
jgi:hypothetical protein